MINNNNDHENIVAILPWFANGALEDDEHTRVSLHLVECSDCRSALEEINQLQKIVVHGESAHLDMHTKVESDYKPSFDKLLNRIDAQERDLSASASRPTSADVVRLTATSAENGRRETTQLSRDIKQPRVWVTFALAASLVVGVFVASGSLRSITSATADNSVHGGQYETMFLSVPASVKQEKSSIYRVDVGFDKDVNAGAVRAVLIKTNAYIVNGPDGSGHYVIEVRTPDHIDSAKMLDAIDVLAGVSYATLVAEKQ